jgi:hypothetical protein
MPVLEPVTRMTLLEDMFCGRVDSRLKERGSAGSLYTVEIDGTRRSSRRSRRWVEVGRFVMGCDAIVPFGMIF